MILKFINFSYNNLYKKKYSWILFDIKESILLKFIDDELAWNTSRGPPTCPDWNTCTIIYGIDLIVKYIELVLSLFIFNNEVKNLIENIFI
jgi:hypothetical protein